MGLLYDKDKCTGCMLCIKSCNFAAIEKDGDKVKSAYLSVRDLAAVMAKVALEGEKHYGQSYNLTGPRALLDSEVAELLSNYLGKPVNYIGVPDQAYRKSLEDKWFDGKSSLNIPVDFKNVTGYYKGKGDDIIQIGSLGAWALQSEFKALGLPMFDDAGATARLRIRIKPDMGADGNHRFNVAIKVSGLGRSKFSLLNPKDVAKLDDFFMNMQESVSRSTIRNAILEVANQFMPAQDAPRNIALRLLEEHGIETAMNIAARDGNFAVLKILMDFGPDSASDVRHFPFGRM